MFLSFDLPLEALKALRVYFKGKFFL